MPKPKTKYICKKAVIMPLCAVPFCKAKKPPFHPFPKDDQQLFDIWKGCVANYRFKLMTDKEIHKHYGVCDDHFVESCKIPITKTLKKYSIPTLNVTGFKTNSNLNIAYNLYIEKQEKDPINQSVKNISLDHNYVDKILVDRNACISYEDLNNCTFINLNSETRSDFLWVEPDLQSVNQEFPPLDTEDPLAKNLGEEINEQYLDLNDISEDNEDIIEQEIITDSIEINDLRNNSALETDSINDDEENTDLSSKKEVDNDLEMNTERVSKKEVKSYTGPNKIIKKAIKPKEPLKSHIKCSVPNCGNRYGSFHKFPTDPELCQTWTQILGIKTPIKDYMKICSNHFRTSDYFVQFVYAPAKINNEKFRSSRMNLKKNAIPFNNINKKFTKKIICAANNCYNNNIDHKKMHFFPFPKDEEMAQTWASNANREDLILIPKFYENKYYLCANHFYKIYFRQGSKVELRSDMEVIPTIFNVNDCMSKPGDSYSTLFMQFNNDAVKYNYKISKTTANQTKNTLQVYINDTDTSKITFNFNDAVDDSRLSSDYGNINNSNSLYEDFVSNPGVLDLKPQTSDLLFQKDYCRLCAKLCSVASLLSIFDKSGHLTMYGNMLDVCLPGKVYANDKLPHWMCSKCEYKLHVCYSSIKQFIEADNQLKNILNKDYIESNQKETDGTDFDSISNISFDNEEVLEQIQVPREINKIIDENEKIENKKYQCLNCDQLCDTKKELVDHSLASHNSDRTQTNIVCEIVSGDKSVSNRKPTSTSTPKVKCSKLRYECVICSSLHEKKDSLIKHSLRYHSTSSRKIVCRVVQISNLRNHHLTCMHCKEEFMNVKKYRKHMKQHLKLNCEQCGKQFTRMHKLLAHAKLHDLKSLSCAKCTLVFTNEMELVKHQVAAHKYVKPDETKCSVCDEEFGTSGELLKHKKKHERSLCNICGKLFSSSTLLKYHLEKHTDVRSHKCSICSKSFQTVLSLKRHKTIHSTENKCICQVCGKQFGYLSVLKSHMYSHSTHRPYVCDLCGAAFHRRNNLKKHLITHEKIKENPYKCKICQKECNSKMMYIRHKQEHAAVNKKPFTCDICSKKFLTKFQAKIHRRIHTGETPYECGQCDKSFRSSALAKQHRLIHMNVFPHQCHYCDRKFRRLQSLIVHRRTHTGEKPYPCPICGRAFASRSDMNKHKRNLHNRKNIPQSNEIPDVHNKQLDIENIFNQDENYYLQDDSSNNILTSILHE